MGNIMMRRCGDVKLREIPEMIIVRIANTSKEATHGND